MMPNSAAACVAAAPPPGSKTCSDPTGASRTGMRSLCPRNSVDVSMLDTSRSTRGRKASRSNASRLRRSVVSDSDPPTR